MSEESMKNTTTSDNTFDPTLIDTCPWPVAKFIENCLITNNIYNFRTLINLYISYELDSWSRDLNTDFTLNNFLFGSVKSTKNAESDQ